jgi:flagellar hook-basal body complex protein FliE
MAIDTKLAGPGLPLAKPLGKTSGIADKLGAPRESKGENFLDLVANAGRDAVKTGKAGELTSMKGMAKEAELADVVTAVSNAELTLQTVVTVRDRVIQAYQDIIRMPI